MPDFQYFTVMIHIDLGYLNLVKAKVAIAIKTIVKMVKQIVAIIKTELAKATWKLTKVVMFTTKLELKQKH